MQTRELNGDGQDTVTPRSLEDTLMACARGYAQLDAALLARLFAEDGQWVDAAGHRLHGRAQIQAHLGELFAQGWLPGDARNVTATISARLLGPDLALASAFTEAQRKRGLALSGGPKTRSVHRLQVLARREQGWQVTTEVMLDERDSRTNVAAPFGIGALVALIGLGAAMLYSTTPVPQHDRTPSVLGAALVREAFAAQAIDAGLGHSPPTEQSAPAPGSASPAYPQPSAEAQALADRLLDPRLSRRLEAQLPDLTAPVSRSAVPAKPGCDDQAAAGWLLCFTR